MKFYFCRFFSPPSSSLPLALAGPFSPPKPLRSPWPRHWPRHWPRRCSSRHSQQDPRRSPLPWYSSSRHTLRHCAAGAVPTRPQPGRAAACPRRRIRSSTRTRESTSLAASYLNHYRASGPARPRPWAHHPSAYPCKRRVPVTAVSSGEGKSAAMLAWT